MNSVNWKQSNNQLTQRCLKLASCVIGGSDCLLSVAECDDGRWYWTVSVDGVIGDHDCEISDGMRRIWLSGHAHSLDDAKRAAEAAQHRTPTTLMPLDVGYDPRASGQAVVVEPDEDSYDGVGYYRWADRDGQPRELLANVWTVAEQMRRDGYAAKVAANGRAM